MMTSAFRAPRSVKARCSARNSAPSSAIPRSRNQRRTSSDTWSLVHERLGCAACRLLACAACSSASMFMWDIFHGLVPFELPGLDFRGRMASSPFTMARRSSTVRTPIFWSMVAWTVEPRDVMPPQPPVRNEMDSVNRRDIRVRPAREPSAAENWRILFHAKFMPNVRRSSAKVTRGNLHFLSLLKKRGGPFFAARLR